MTLSPSPGYASFSEKLGAIFDVCSRTKSYRMMPLLNLRAWIIPAIELNQAVVFYAPTGAALAYFSWAYLSEDDSRDFCMGRSRPFTQNQRLGGEDFWITDLAACDGALHMVIDYIKEHVASEVAVINFKAKRRNGSLRYIRKTKQL